MSMVQISWRPDSAALRKFGLVVIVGFAIIGAALQFIGSDTALAYVAYGAGLVLGVPALTGTVIGLPGYWLWMGVGFVMGNIVGRVLLSVVYYGLITPMGVIRRQLNDKLQLKRPNKTSYWIDIDNSGERGRYERLF